MIIGMIASLVLLVISSWAVLSESVRDCLGTRLGLAGVAICSFFHLFNPSILTANWVMFWAAWLATAAIIRRFRRTVKGRA